MFHLTHKLAIAAVLFLSMSVAGYAKSKTIGDITLDVPDAFEASASARGVELKTPDEEVYTWFETYKGSEGDTLQAEHAKYWKENDVVLNDPEMTDKKSGDIHVATMFFPHATWQGKPTVLRYVKIGPVAAQRDNGSYDGLGFAKWYQHAWERSGAHAQHLKCEDPAIRKKLSQAAYRNGAIIISEGPTGMRGAPLLRWLQLR